MRFLLDEDLSPAVAEGRLRRPCPSTAVSRGSCRPPTAGAWCRSIGSPARWAWTSNTPAAPGSGSSKRSRERGGARRSAPPWPASSGRSTRSAARAPISACSPRCSGTAATRPRRRVDPRGGRSVAALRRPDRPRAGRPPLRRRRSANLVKSIAFRYEGEYECFEIYFVVTNRREGSNGFGRASQHDWRRDRSGSGLFEKFQSLHIEPLWKSESALAIAPTVFRRIDWSRSVSCDVSFGKQNALA